MKKILLFLLTFLPLLAWAKFDPNTKWPYIYEEFNDGTIYFANKQKTAAKLNVHLMGNKLHFVDQSGAIRVNDGADVIRVEIGEDAYIFVEGKLMQVVASNGTIVAVKLVKADFDRLNAGTGAYGTATNSASVRTLSSIELAGMDAPQLGKMLQEKDNGSYIPTDDEYYILINGKRIEASKKEVAKILSPAKQAEWKSFLKQNKIKWSRASDLQKVVDFIAQ